MNYIPVDCNGLNGEHLSSLFYFIYFSISMSCVQWSFTSCAEIERELIFIFWKIWTVTSLSDKSTIILCWNPSETFWMLIVLQYAFSLIVGFFAFRCTNWLCHYRNVIVQSMLFLSKGHKSSKYIDKWRLTRWKLLGLFQKCPCCFNNEMPNLYWVCTICFRVLQ